jgi:hypothetical protein
MNGYLYHASATNACGTSAFSTNATLTVSNQVLVSGAGINNVACGDNTILKDHAGDADYANSRNDFSVINAGLGATITLSGNYSTELNWDYVRIYNGSGTGGTLLATFTGAGAINYIGNPGQTLTVQFTSDGSGINTGFQINVTYSGVCNPVCTTPTAQPTALSFAPSGNSITGGFTAASPVADNYLVVVSTSAIPPTAPVNGVSYTIGGTLAPGYTIVDIDSNTSFTATGLSLSTTYYFYIYAFNSVCTGGPLYLGTAPLTGSTTTLAASYCIPTISAAFQTSTSHHIRKVEFIGTLQDITNTSSFPTLAPFGYEDYTGLAVKSIQAKGEGVNIYMESPNSGFIKAWVDWNSDGDFADAGETVYNAGTVAQASTTLGFIVPIAIPAGDYRVRLRISGRNGIGPDAGSAWNSCSTNLAYYGETEDYILRVIENCAARISTITNGSVCGNGIVTLGVTGTIGTTEFRWYSAQTGGTLLATTPTGTWNTPSISASTNYWVTAFNGTCETLVRS